MMAMLPFVLFDFKQIKALQKHGAFLNFIFKIAGLVESVVVCICVAKRTRTERYGGRLLGQPHPCRRTLHISKAD